MKENKYGCIVSGDVCLKHDRPLISFGFCEDSPDIIAFIKQIRQQAIDQTREETIMECEGLLPEEYETPWDSIDAETCMIQLGYNEAVKEIKQSLINLRK